MKHEVIRTSIKTITRWQRMLDSLLEKRYLGDNSSDGEIVKMQRSVKALTAITLQNLQKI